MKLGLIAMSGVRCYNKELMDYGLTLPGFLERSKVIASLPSLGLLTLAGMTPDDIEIGYVEVPDPDSLGDDLPGEFDVVAISSFSSMIKGRLRDRRPLSPRRHRGDLGWPARYLDAGRGRPARGCDSNRRS